MYVDCVGSGWVFILMYGNCILRMMFNGERKQVQVRKVESI